jgi:NADH-quinone oxidoreductase subunit G
VVDTVQIVVDGQTFEVPAGANLVDAAKWYAGTDIPIFCYHPKMEPVGMCRMCLVDIGYESRDRASGEPVLNPDGTPEIRWGRTLQTACTQYTGAGMHVRTMSQEVKIAREHVLEFLLTSHPLDCPICDKGGECPLQNLTMDHGPGTSRMYYEDKIRLDKHVPLGDLIFLDRERCIQCGRCVRFQAELVGDDVLAFHERGRRLQIITESEPHGFDTYFSGNTTDICPVGALTTADFRFSARPWELKNVPSISPWDAAGENTVLSTRLDRESGGKVVIKRVLPRQNESVNELWISDKTRFGHHFTRSEDRLAQPMHRLGNRLVETTWDYIVDDIAKLIGDAGGDVAAIAGSGASNEDLWVLRRLIEQAGGKRLGAWPPTHAGQEMVATVGIPTGGNLGALGKGDAVLVIASDLEEEVPIWRLRLKLAQDRGAYLVVAHHRHTRMEDFATDPVRNDRVLQGDAIRYEAGQAVGLLAGLKDSHPEIYQRLADAGNLVVVAGAEGLTSEGSAALMRAAANLLIRTKHAGEGHSGLLGTFPGPNAMGLHYLGYSIADTRKIAAKPPKVLLVLQAELLDDDPTAQPWLEGVDTIVSLGLWRDRLAELADYVLPIQSFAERDGTWINGERRVQRFYAAQSAIGDAAPGWRAIERLATELNGARGAGSANAIMREISRFWDGPVEITYAALAKVERQFPDIDSADMYYGGTVHVNTGGLGIQLPCRAESEKLRAGKVASAELPTPGKDEVLLVPATRLYDRSLAFRPTLLVRPRVMAPYAQISAADAKRLRVADGDVIALTYVGGEVRVRAVIDGDLTAGVVVVPRYLTDTPVPLEPSTGQIRKVAEAQAAPVPVSTPE